MMHNKGSAKNAEQVFALTSLYMHKKELSV